MKRKIGIVTGTRADFGLLSRTITLLQSDHRFETRVFACGTHLSPEFGLTISELEAKNISNIVPVEMLVSSSSRVGIAKSVGLATIAFADAFSRENLDCLLVLGDRYEILAAAQTAMFLNIPLAHIHGGEVTEGAFDDCIRHSISKMANIHFPVAKEFAKRIRQLGEQDNSIFIVGSPGVDNIVNEPRLSKSELESSLGFTLPNALALVTYHPVTQTSNIKENDVTPLINMIKNTPQITYVITYPNADNGGQDIIKQWQSIAHLQHVQIIPSLGFLRYLSLMEHVEVVIGNSSSGLIEAPSFHVATINIGSRQDGRPRASSIIDVAMSEKSLSEALHKSRSADFKAITKKAINPYGEGDTALSIVNILSKIDFSNFCCKTFTDREFDE